MGLSTGGLQIRDLVTIVIPTRRRITVHSGCNVMHFIFGEVVDRDEAVIAAIGSKRDTRAIRRPLLLGFTAAQLSELMRGFVTGYGGNPQMMLGANPHRQRAVGRELNVFTILFVATHVTEQTWLPCFHVG